MPRKEYRISEADLLIPTLRTLAKQPNRRMTTSRLIVELEALFQPTGDDAEILEGRNNSHFSQIVRNMVSHKGAQGNIIADGQHPSLPLSEWQLRTAPHRITARSPLFKAR